MTSQLRQDNHALRKRINIMERMAALAMLEAEEAKWMGDDRVERYHARRICDLLRQIPGIQLVAERIKETERQEAEALSGQ